MNSARRRLQSWSPLLIASLSFLYLGLLYLFILLPIGMVFLAAFNSESAVGSPLSSFTLHWFQELLKQREILKSIGTSALVAAAAAGLAAGIGLPLAILLVRSRFPGRVWIDAFFSSPLIIPQIALGLALLLTLSLLKISISLFYLVLLHTVFVLPYLLRALVGTLQFIDPALEEASRNLGADRLRTFWFITLPNLRPGLIAGYVLAFILSFVNVPLSLFLSTPEYSMLPIRILNYMESRLDPIVAMVAVLNITAVILISLFLDKVLRIKLIV